MSHNQAKAPVYVLAQQSVTNQFLQNYKVNNDNNAHAKYLSKHIGRILNIMFT